MDLITIEDRLNQARFERSGLASECAALQAILAKQVGILELCDDKVKLLEELYEREKSAPLAFDVTTEEPLETPIKITP